MSRISCEPTFSSGKWSIDGTKVEASAGDLNKVSALQSKSWCARLVADHDTDGSL